MASTKKVTVPVFVSRKESGEKITVLTAYDHPTAQLFDERGVDCLLVGDTLGMVVQGHDSTLPVTMDEMVYHTSLVSRGAKRSLVVGDMPFLSYHTGVDEAVRNAGRLIKEGGADAVKLEGGVVRAETIRAIVDAEIPLMGHIGLTPQSIRRLGRYHVQRDAEAILADAKAIEHAGAFAVVLESVPLELGRAVTEALNIPTIGIGAGPHCDGQVLVWQDAFGLNDDFTARFVKRFADLRTEFSKGVDAYIREVKEGTFPSSDNSYR
ncbi:3-methyl-2-oxobutanoate hydroxymethyltransferase [Planctomycetes bacterium Pan216]